MYNPPLFRENDTDTLHGIIRESRLALLVSADPDGGVPDATHLPLLLDPADGPHGTLLGHVARANPHWRALQKTGRHAHSGPPPLLPASRCP